MTQYNIEIDYTQASCTKATNPDVFWPVGKDDLASVEIAKAFCATCPEKLKCLDHALHHEREGIWGETTPGERDALRRKMRINLEPITYSK